MTALIQAIGISRRVAGVKLLDDVKLQVCAGDRLSLVGPVGSGKTVLLRAIAMLDRIDTGTILWRGEPVSGNGVPAYRSCVTYVHQRPVISAGTVEDNLRDVLTLQTHRGKVFDRKRMRSLLEALARDESFLSKDHRELSGGELQIAALLRVMQLDPQVLLLDEPTAALDRQTALAIESLVRHWQSEKADVRATLWVSHDSQQAQRVADRTLRMAGGRLETAG